MADLHDLIDLHDQVRLKDPPEAYVGVVGTVVHVFTSDYANMTDHDVSVHWSNGQRTNECNANLEKVTA